MIKAFLLFLLPLTLFGAEILSYNVYERTDRADVMFTFDTPYTGTIKQSQSTNKMVIKLEDASIESYKIKKVNSEYLKSLTITPLVNYTQIVALTDNSARLIVSKTSDGYGLRLRFTKTTTPAQQNVLATKTAATANDLSSLPTKKSEDISTSYYVVIAILLLGILVLLYLKNKLQNKQATPQNSWLFKQNETLPHTPVKVKKAEVKHNPSNDEITIRFQKALDPHNRVVMLDFLDQSYLVLVGNGNILLDKFIEDGPATEQEFETLLQEKHSELESFLENPTTHKEDTSSIDSLQAYKERAANLAYTE